MADISMDAFCHYTAASSSRPGEMIAEDARTHFDRGMAWARIGGYEQALASWKQALHFAPDLAGAHAAIGSVYMARGCWQEAVQSYQQAILAAPDLRESYYGLGSAYGHLGQYDLAIQAFEQGLSQAPCERETIPAPRTIGLDAPEIRATPPERDTLQDRLRSHSENFDFAALLSSPEERRQEERQQQEQAAETAPAAIAAESVPIAATAPDYFSEENVRIIEPHPTSLQSSGMPLPPAELVRRKRIAFVVGVLVVITSVGLEVFFITH